MTKFAQFLVIAALVFMAKGDEEIIDFTYSGKYTESSNSHQINIRPNERSAKDFQYPAICSFYTRFEEMRSFKVSESTSTDVQSLENIQNQNKKMESFLAVSQEIKSINLKIKAFQKTFSTTNTNEKKQQLSAQLKLLKQEQAELQKWRDDIQRRIAEIERLREDQKPSESSSSRLTAVNYEIQVLKGRLRMLQELLDKSSSSSADIMQLNVGQKFDHVDNILRELNDLMKQKTRMTGSSQKMTKLKTQISQLESNDKSISLEINHLKENINHFKQSPFTQKSISTLRTLRDQKKQQLQMNVASDYCQKVTVRLIKQIKKWLVINDQHYNDRTKLAELQDKIISIRQKLKQKRQEFKQLDKNANKEEFYMKETKYENDFSRNMKEITGLQISTHFLYLDDFKYSAKDVQSIITQTKQKLRQLENERKDLERTKEPSRPTFNQRQFQNKVRDLKALKAKYCQKYSKYEARATLIEIEFGKLRSSLNSIQSTRKAQQRQIAKLEELQDKLEKLRDQLIEMMEN